MRHQNIDKFFKVSAILFGQLFVDEFGLDYHVIRLYRNELNCFNGKNLFSDLVFETREGVLLNFEFQDVKVSESHLKKYMEYKVLLQCQSGKPVVTVVICTYHIKSEVYIYNETETSILKPIIHYLTDYYDEVKYISLKNKIINNLRFSHREVQYLILLPFMVHKNLRKLKIMDVCNLIEDIKKNKLFDDDEMYLPLILAINQYVSNDDEKNKLIEVLTMDMPADEIYEKVMNSGIFEQGLEQGLEQGKEKGKFDMALKIKRSLGIEEAIKISGFSREELQNEVLIKNR